MSEERSPMQREADRRAHKAARKALQARAQRWKVWHASYPKGSIGHERARAVLAGLDQKLDSALDAYEEIEKRQQREATL